MHPAKSIYSYLAAAVLAVVTVFTFYVFQDFGPQSVIRRFHRDAVRADANDINAITTEGWNAPETQWTVRFVQSLVGPNASYEIVRVARVRGEVLAFVQYRLPSGEALWIAWHVRQGPNDWRIDCRRTLEDYQGRLLGNQGVAR